MKDFVLLNGDAEAMLDLLPDASVQCCVTSPPYWGLRCYGHEKQLGQEKSPEEYVASLLKVFTQVWRVLKPDGTLWLNLGDSYSNAGTRQGDRDGGVTDAVNEHRKVGNGYRTRVGGLKNKDLIGIPWRVAFALQSAGWYLRSDIIWAKPNPMPESVTDRCTRSHEYIFMLSKAARYYYDADAVAEPTECDRIRGPAQHPDTLSTNGNGGLSRRAIESTRNKRDVWTITPAPFKGAHFATFPPKLIEPCILAGSRPGDTVLDPFIGSGTTAQVALSHGRKCVGIELNPEYLPLIHKRVNGVVKKVFTMEDF